MDEEIRKREKQKRKKCKCVWGVEREGKKRGGKSRDIIERLQKDYVGTLERERNKGGRNVSGKMRKRGKEQKDYRETQIKAIEKLRGRIKKRQKEM